MPRATITVSHATVPLKRHSNTRNADSFMRKRGRRGNETATRDPGRSTNRDCGTMLQNCFAMSADEVLRHFEVDRKDGLSSAQVAESLQKFGVNELPKEKGTSLWRLILGQFEDQLVQILLAAAAVSFALAWAESAGDTGSDRFSAFVEPFVILLILTANAVVGVAQESSAEKAIEALRSYAPDSAKVVRNGELVKVHAYELVPGDLVEVAVGDRIPADLRLVEMFGKGLRVDQAILTGESVSVQKYADAVLTDLRAVKQDQVNVVFSGTTVTMGRGRGVVVLTGSKTAIGEIQSSLSSAAEQGDGKTPLKRRLDQFGDQLARIISAICVLVWLVNFRHFSDPQHGGLVRGAIYYFKVAVALAVAAIPEGLAVIITTCLALGTRKMAKRNAIVRTLPSVETLGCTSVICSDKTGTLTTNEMAVSGLCVFRDADGPLAELTVQGSSYSPSDGGVVGRAFGIDASQEPALARLAAICALCNDAVVSWNGHRHVKVGEATEAALKVLVEKLGSVSPRTNAAIQEMKPGERAAAVGRHFESVYSRVATLDFDRDRKSMSVLVRMETTGEAFLFVKGAPEGVMERSRTVLLEGDGGEVTDFSAGLRTRVSDQMAVYGRDALRTLAVAYRRLRHGELELIVEKHLEDPEQYVHIEQGLTFVGLVAMADPVRPEVRSALAQCRAAGIRVVVLTGDNKETAEAVGRQVGLFAPDEEVTAELSLTGAVFDALSPEDQQDILPWARLFSRVEPRHKTQLVRLLQEAGHVVAMTGDGVNDAPALKRADIGIAMGSGTDVARAVADLVLTDDNFSTIVAAVEEGRSIYANTKQFVRYLISSNIGEVACILGTALTGLPEALSPVQLLWVNLVTDGLPATALGFNPASPSSMREPPRSRDEPLVSRWLFLRYLIIGTYVGVATVGGFVWSLCWAASGPQLPFLSLTHGTTIDTTVASSVSLSILVTIEMANALNSLSENESIFQLPPWTNPSLIAAVLLSMALHCAILYVPLLARIFGVAPLGHEEWLAVLVLSLPVILLDELLKAITRWSRRPVNWSVDKKSD